MRHFQFIILIGAMAFLFGCSRGKKTVYVQVPNNGNNVQANLWLQGAFAFADGITTASQQSPFNIDVLSLYDNSIGELLYLDGGLLSFPYQVRQFDDEPMSEICDFDSTGSYKAYDLDVILPSGAQAGMLEHYQGTCYDGLATYQVGCFIVSEGVLNQGDTGSFYFETFPGGCDNVDVPEAYFNF